VLDSIAAPLRGRLGWRFFASASPTTWAWIFGVGALLVRLPLFFTEHDAVPGGDSRQYLAIADGLLDGQGFETDAYRTPGYPLFIAALQLLPGPTGDAVVVAQHLIGVGLVVAVLLVAWRFFGKAPALVAAALVAFTPVMPALENMILADFLFGTAIFAGAVALAYALADRISPRLLVLTGVVFGLAANVKPSGQFLIVAAPLALLATTRSVRQTVKWGAVPVVAFALTITPWIIHNEVVDGHAAMSIQGGRTLFNRVFEVDELPIPTDSPDGRLVARLQERIRDQEGVRLNNVALAEFRSRGLTQYEAFQRMRKLALEAIREDPLRYGSGTAAAVGRFATNVNKFSYDDLNKREAGAVLDRFKLGGVAEIATRAWFYTVKALSVSWLIVSLFGLASLLTLTSPNRRVRAAGAAFVFTWLTIAVGTSLTHGGIWRYGASQAALLWTAASAGAVLLVTAVVTARRQPEARSVDRDRAQATRR
jgi:4-amino-4-deoxy-L-arabinose transferase-like glycosyltransferase